MKRRLFCVSPDVEKVENTGIPTYFVGIAGVNYNFINAALASWVGD
jgi:hypothetical protein